MLPIINKEVVKSPQYEQKLNSIMEQKT